MIYFTIEYSHTSEKISKTIRLLRKLQDLLPRATLIIIYKPFIRRHLDFGDILTIKPICHAFHQKLKSIQYNPRFAITRAIGSTLLYQELGLESRIV